MYNKTLYIYKIIGTIIVITNLLKSLRRNNFLFNYKLGLCMPLIAVIDDDHDILEATELILKASNFEVITIDNPTEGYNVVKMKNPDLIILDVMMEEPDDGFFLAQKFRREGIKTPILMYTSIAKAVGMEFGAGEMVPVDDFVEKPIASDELIKKVKKLLSDNVLR